MKFFVALALLFFVAAEAHHNPRHSLREPPFKPDLLYVYDVEFNVSSGVLGLSTQVAKTAIKAEVSVYAKNKKEHFLKVDKVYTSGSLKGLESFDGYIKMERNSDLENRLSEPTRFTLEKGEVTSYTLSSRDNLESKKIRKSILRSLEMHVPESEIVKMETKTEMAIPVTYNVSKSTEFGVHTTHYMITVSPDAEFPVNGDVYNITRTDNFEAELYPAHYLHSNFRKQGCSEVCRKDWRSNEYGAGCPVGFEPHHTPVKTSFNHQHHLSYTKGTMNPEMIKTTEVHVAQMYDQDMMVLIEHTMKRKSISHEAIVEPPKQTSHTDLNDWETEINEKEINAKCNYKTSKEAADVVSTLLQSITNIVVDGKLEDKKSTIIGEQVIMLKKALTRLSVQDFEKIIQKDIIEKRSIKKEDIKKKVMRQIWLDMLPLIGTEESVTFIVSYIKNMDKNLMIWEAKEILEALPQNIAKPSERNVRELQSLLTDNAVKKNMEKYHVLHSAVHMTIARVLGHMCGNIAVVRSEPVQRSSWFSNYRLALRSIQEVRSSSQYGPITCPEGLVKDIVKDITEKLMNTEEKQEIAVYLETLANIGIPEVLPVIAKYVYGVAEPLEKYAPKFINFVKSVSLYSLHNVVVKHPEEVLQIVLPVFFNRTETPKVRNAAFGVLIRCEPSIEILERIAHKSWDEPSKDVASFVMSTFETFGNSSLPCMQLTSHRIKKVMPHVMKLGYGVQYAKNFHWSYFDDLRNLGIEGRFEYTPNNESFIPSNIYESLHYSTDSLRDVLIQMSLNMEGVTQKKIFDYIDQEILGIRAPDSIPNSIFYKANMAERIPEHMRFTMYKRMFYMHSFFYFDQEFFVTQMRPFFEYMETYLKPTRYDVNGQLVKVILPSSFHAITIAKTLPYPVEFEMIQPLIIAVKVKSLERNSDFTKFNIYVKPSVYFTKLYTNQMKNLGDCKEVGVYHEHKVSASIPFEIKCHVTGLLDLEVSYKLPELKKRTFFSYFSESGTYAGKKDLEVLPSIGAREPIKTIPSPFKFENKIDVVGFPPMNLEIHTEDIQMLRERMPRNPMEAFEMVIKKMLNAGWRRKSVNITAEEDSELWPEDTQVTFKVKYNKDHVTMEEIRLNKPQRDQSRWNSDWASESQLDSQPNWSASPEEDWSKDLMPDDVETNRNPKEFIDQGRNTLFKLLNTPHVAHLLEMEVKTKPVYSAAYMKMSYNHTYSKSMHAMHVDAAAFLKHESRPHMISMDNIMAFMFQDNEFKYKTSDERTAILMSTLKSHRHEHTSPWEDVDIVSKVVLTYKNPEEFLKNDIMGRVDPQYFLPETHKKCLKDIEDGQPQSMDCVKALRERTVYNHMDMAIFSEKNLPEILKKASYKVDLYFKHFLFQNLHITDEMNTEDKVQIKWNYIDKFTDKPVMDFTIRKPEETLEFKKVPTYGVQPLSSIYGMVESASMEATNNTYPATCVMMKNYVRTYDQKSYQFWADKCEYILTSHCTHDKNFAIIAKAIDKREGTKEVRAYIGKNTIILSPKSDASYRIKINEREYKVHLTPVIFNEDSDEIYASTEGSVTDTLKGEDRLRVVAGKAGVSILYDGVNVKVQIDPRYKGEMCGLCSEFDGDELREYRGVDRCLYSNALDFAFSSILKREGSCEKSHMMGEKMCDDTENMVHIP